MLGFLMRQTVTGILTLFLVVSLTFVLLRFLPGGPFDQERALPPAIKANIEAQYHLDKPMWVQYGYYLSDLIKGDLGPSYKYKSRRVNDIVGEATAVSFYIGFIALAVGVTLGLLLGALAGLTRSYGVDGVLSLVGMSSISMPAFIFGGLLVLIFSLKLHWLPAATLATPTHYILPVLTLALVPFAYSFLLVRTSVREMRNQPHVRIKHSYGVPNIRIDFLHIVRNSLIPLVSILGPIAAAIVTGSFAVEYIFAVPGLGKYFINAVSNRDYTLVMGITIIYGVALIVFNTCTEMIFGLLDPRLRIKSAA